MLEDQGVTKESPRRKWEVKGVEGYKLPPSEWGQEELIHPFRRGSLDTKLRIFQAESPQAGGGK